MDTIEGNDNPQRPVAEEGEEEVDAGTASPPPLIEVTHGDVSEHLEFLEREMGTSLDLHQSRSDNVPVVFAAGEEGSSNNPNEGNSGNINENLDESQLISYIIAATNFMDVNTRSTMASASNVQDTTSNASEMMVRGLLGQPLKLSNMKSVDFFDFCTLTPREVCDRSQRPQAPPKTTSSSTILGTTGPYEVQSRIPMAFSVLPSIPVTQPLLPTAYFAAGPLAAAQSTLTTTSITSSTVPTMQPSLLVTSSSLYPVTMMQSSDSTLLDAYLSNTGISTISTRERDSFHTSGVEPPYQSMHHPESMTRHSLQGIDNLGISSGDRTLEMDLISRYRDSRDQYSDSNVQRESGAQYSDSNVQSETRAQYRDARSRSYSGVHYSDIEVHHSDSRPNYSDSGACYISSQGYVDSENNESVPEAHYRDSKSDRDSGDVNRNLEENYPELGAYSTFGINRRDSGVNYNDPRGPGYSGAGNRDSETPLDLRHSGDSGTHYSGSKSHRDSGALYSDSKTVEDSRSPPIDTMSQSSASTPYSEYASVSDSTPYSEFVSIGDSRSPFSDSMSISSNSDSNYNIPEDHYSDNNPPPGCSKSTYCGPKALRSGSKSPSSGASKVASGGSKSPRKSSKSPYSGSSKVASGGSKSPRKSSKSPYSGSRSHYSGSSSPHCGAKSKSTEGRETKPTCALNTGGAAAASSEDLSKNSKKDPNSGLPYQCSRCSSAFAKINHLYRHLQDEHNVP